MKTTTELKVFAQLAQASYSLLNDSLIYGDVPPFTKTTDALKASPNGAFSEGQATDFINRYSVLNQYRDNSDRCQRRFQRHPDARQSQPQSFGLSFVGTKVNGAPGGFVNDRLSDVQIGVVGYVVPQASLAQRYVKKLQTSVNVAVNYRPKKLNSSTTFAQLNELVKAGSNGMKANYQSVRDGLRRVLLRPRKT